MRTRIIAIGLATFLTAACSISFPEYLPRAKEVKVNPNGAYLKLSCNPGPDVAGELIAVEEDAFIVLPQDSSHCQAIPLINVTDFDLYFAKPPNHWPAFALTFLSTVTHGIFLIFTAPVNLLVGGSVALSARSSVRYTPKNATANKLKLFARFPQGLPPGVDWEDIR